VENKGEYFHDTMVLKINGETMSIAVQTSYSANLKFVDRTSTTSNVQKSSASTTSGSARAAQLPSLEETLGPDNFKQLEKLRARKEALMGRLPDLQSRFDTAEKAFGANLKDDIDEIVDIGRSVFRTALQLKNIEKKISALLGDVDPAGVAGVAEGKGNQKFDAETLQKDRAFAANFKSFTEKLFGAYETTKDSAQQAHDRDALKSHAMKLADKHGRKLVNLVSNYQSNFANASVQSSSLSLIV
jgi:hypothetical protein